jgi:hypothetical protein
MRFRVPFFFQFITSFMRVELSQLSYQQTLVFPDSMCWLVGEKRCVRLLAGKEQNRGMIAKYRLLVKLWDIKICGIILCLWFFCYGLLLRLFFGVFAPNRAWRQFLFCRVSICRTAPFRESLIKSYRGPQMAVAPMLHHDRTTARGGGGTNGGSRYATARTDDHVSRAAGHQRTSRGWTKRPRDCGGTWLLGVDGAQMASARATPREKRAQF